MYSYYYGFDWTYLGLLIPCLLLSMWAGAKVNSTFRKYSGQLSARHITGAQAADLILRQRGIYNVRIARVAGKLTDHYDPRENVIRLSADVYDSTSTAAIGVACHEAGHAMQYARDYLPIKIRAAIIPLTNFSSRAAMPLILLGVLLGFLGEFSMVLVYLGIGCFALSLLFQLVTLPVEFDASRRAMQSIDETAILNAQERVGARKTLTAAAMTYVAAVAVSLAQLIRLITLYGRRHDD